MKKEIKKTIEDLGWVVESDTCIHTLTNVCDREIYIECNNKGELKETINNYYHNYDVDEEVEMYLQAKHNGLEGVPSASVLVKDCEDEENILGELWYTVMDFPNF